MFISWIDCLFYCVVDFCFLLFVMIIIAIVEDRKRSKKDKKEKGN